MKTALADNLTICFFYISAYMNQELAEFFGHSPAGRLSSLQLGYSIVIYAEAVS